MTDLIAKLAHEMLINGEQLNNREIVKDGTQFYRVNVFLEPIPPDQLMGVLHDNLSMGEARGCH